MVEFPGTAGVTHRGRILQASDGPDSSVKVMDERDGKMVSFSTPVLPAVKSRHFSVRCQRG